MEELNLKLNMENLTSEERETLTKLIEKGSAEKGVVWKPKKDETYWHITDMGIVEEIKNFADKIDVWNVESGNYYKTDKQAEFAKQKKIIETKLERLSKQAWSKGGGESDKYKGFRRWFFYFDKMCNEIMTSGQFTSISVGSNFPTQASALNAIEEVGEDNIIKYIFGVKGE